LKSKYILIYLASFFINSSIVNWLSESKPINLNANSLRSSLIPSFNHLESAEVYLKLNFLNKEIKAFIIESVITKVYGRD